MHPVLLLDSHLYTAVRDIVLLCDESTLAAGAMCVAPVQRRHSRSTVICKASSDCSGCSGHRIQLTVFDDWPTRFIPTAACVGQ